MTAPSRTAEARRALFASEYLIDHNATRAAGAAGYSLRTANEQATRLLADVRVRALVAAGEAETRERLRLTRDDVVDELRSLAWSDLSEAMPWDEHGPHLRPSKDIPIHVRRQVKSIHFKRSRRVSGRGDAETEWEVEDIRVTMHDKLQSLTLLAKHLGVVSDQPAQVNVFGAFASLTTEELRAIARQGQAPMLMPPPIDVTPQHFESLSAEQVS